MTDSQENSRQTKILEGIEGIQLNKRYREFSVSVSLTTQTLVEVMAATTLRTLPPPARRQAQTPTGTNRAGGQKAKITVLLYSQSLSTLAMYSAQVCESVTECYHGLSPGCHKALLSYEQWAGSRSQVRVPRHCYKERIEMGSKLHREYLYFDTRRGPGV